MAKTLGKVAMRIAFPSFDDTLPVYANNATVQFLGDEFIISFYAAFPPLVAGPEEAEKVLGAGELTVPAKCVAKVVITRSRMPDIVKALADNAAKAKSAEVETSAAEETDG
jgi:hypothetical protein